MAGLAAAATSWPRARAMRGQPGPLRPLRTRGKRLWSPLRPPAGAARPPERPEPVQPQGWRSRVLIARNARGCEGYRADPRQSSFGSLKNWAGRNVYMLYGQYNINTFPKCAGEAQKRDYPFFLLDSGISGSVGNIPFTGSAPRKAQVNT